MYKPFGCIYFHTEYDNLLGLITVLYIIFLFYFVTLLLLLISMAGIIDFIATFPPSLLFSVLLLESSCRISAWSFHITQRFTCHFGLMEPGINLLQINILYHPPPPEIEQFLSGLLLLSKSSICQKILNTDWTCCYTTQTTQYLYIARDHPLLCPLCCSEKATFQKCTDKAINSGVMLPWVKKRMGGRKV